MSRDSDFLERVVIPAVCRLVNAELAPLVKRIEALERKFGVDTKVPHAEASER
jgi:hypothetical protein